MRPNVLLVAAAAVLFSGWFSRPALANEQVQLKAFMVTGASTRKARAAAFPVTLFFETRSSKDAAELCNKAPKYRETILLHLGNKRYPMTGKTELDVTAIQVDLEPVIKKIDRNSLILKMEVVQGVPKISKNSAITFARTGCILVR